MFAFISSALLFLLALVHAAPNPQWNGYGSMQACQQAAINTYSTLVNQYQTAIAAQAQAYNGYASWNPVAVQQWQTQYQQLINQANTAFANGLAAC